MYLGEPEKGQGTFEHTLLRKYNTFYTLEIFFKKLLMKKVKDDTRSGKIYYICVLKYLCYKNVHSSVMLNENSITVSISFFSIEKKLSKSSYEITKGPN